jgi:DNA-binding transcriptional MerR regulator
MIISISSRTSGKEVKPVKIPKSIAFAAEKTKSRIVKAVPGRYILKNRKGMFVVVRFKDETRYTASVGTKLFSASSTESDVEDYFVVESESNQPGARNSAAGNKLGKKNHAKGMLAAGWWLFVKRADGKMQKAYIGGRISGRRLLGLLDPSTVKTEEPKKPIKPKAKAGKFKVVKLNGRNLYDLKIKGKSAATLSATQKVSNIKSMKKLGLDDKEIQEILSQLKTEPPKTVKDSLKERKEESKRNADSPLKQRVRQLNKEQMARDKANENFSNKKAPELKNYGTDMRTLVDAIVVASASKDPKTLTKYVKEIAAKAHEAWAAQFRKDNPDQKSRVKATKDADWIKANGSDKVDILNTKFDDLPSDWQAENLKGGTASLAAFMKAGKVISKDPKADISIPLEKASDEVHKKWLERNGAWAQEDQKVSYAKLSETEKQKDRDFIANTIKVLSKYR